jgi:uncharacterized protein (TIGR00159 family)
MIPLIELFILLVFVLLIYRFLKGSVAFYILFGIVIIYLISLALNYLGFKHLSIVITQINRNGLIILAIIFQPELRKMLMTIGKNEFANKLQNIKKFMSEDDTSSFDETLLINEIAESIWYLSSNKNGAIIVLQQSSDLEKVVETGVRMDSKVASKLIESVFVKDSPLHDGALVIQGNIIRAASCSLPISEHIESSERFGLRHKSAIGLTEVCDAIVFVVSETTGGISHVENGVLTQNISMDQVHQILNLIFKTNHS